ncbi:M14 family zinc carboxypeptidase [Litorihabitans aurantiacus]|uniref:Zinc carboxypeptidase n=1 Tax=Litorihabitans aurantiacus TaxID=1930061 RepID=A0AA37XG69_9MICO|nr:M14 family zinc carboxypeptidase [Litorihabitans aurantiacus]GMA32670.1 hypothetical protein GCM10025875_26620 [Litorihabitans aurantiacus]
MTPPHPRATRTPAVPIRPASALLTLAVATAGLVLASPSSAEPGAPGAGGASVPADDSPVLLRLAPGNLDRSELAAALAGVDVVTSTASEVTVLGDPGTRADLEAAGLVVLEQSTYAETLDGAVPPTTGGGTDGADGGSMAPEADGDAADAADVSYPLAARLADRTYETFFGGYRTVDAHAQYLTDLEDAYPELVEVVDYGDSWLKEQGRGGNDLLAVRLTAGADTDGDWEDAGSGKPRFVLGAQTHARELITSEMAWRFVTDVVNGYGTDPDLTRLLETTELWVVPQTNPDGIEVVQEAFAAGVPTNAAGDAVPPASSRAWHRKNLNDTEGGGADPNRYNVDQPGVDLNRNYPTGWGLGVASAIPSDLVYRGSAPFSEPESAEQAALLTTLLGSYEVGPDRPAPADRTGVALTLHAYSDYVMYPYGYDETAPVPNLEELRALGFRQSFGNGFATGKPGEILYSNGGSDLDWAYEQLGVPAYTWEIGNDSTGGFFPAYSRADAFWEASGAGLLYAATAAGDPYVSPRGPSVTGVEVEYGADGALSVSGTASDDTYTTEPSSAGRRPATSPVTEVEVRVRAADGVSAPGVGARVSVAVAPDGVTASFAGSAAPDWDVRARQWVEVRARNEAGFWGPWEARWLEPAPVVLSDVAAGQDFEREIRWLVDSGISTGWDNGDGTAAFRPLAPVARDAVAAFLHRLAGSPAVALPASSPFTDVGPGNEFYAEIVWLSQQGIATGWPTADGRAEFRPLDPIARDAIAAFLHRASGRPEVTLPASSPFADVDPANQFYAEIAWLQQSGIATGWRGNDGTALFQPLAPVARDAFAAFLYRSDLGPVRPG